MRPTREVPSAAIVVNRLTKYPSVRAPNKLGLEPNYLRSFSAHCLVFSAAEEWDVLAVVGFVWEPEYIANTTPCQELGACYDDRFVNLVSTVFLAHAFDLRVPICLPGLEKSDRGNR
jgi:hypothetical protein